MSSYFTYILNSSQSVMYQCYLYAIRNNRGIAEFHLSGLIGTGSHTDTQKIRKLDFSSKRLHWQFEVRLLLFKVRTCVLNISTTPDLHFYKPQHCTVLDAITGNFKSSYFCRILDKFTGRAKPFRIIGVPDSQLPD